MKNLLLLLINFCFINLTYAYSNQDSLKAVQNEKKALSFFKSGNIDSAIIYENQAIDFYRSQNNLQSWFIFYWRKGYLFQGLNDYYAGIDAYQIGISNKWRMPRTHEELRTLASIYISKGFLHGFVNDHKSKVTSYEAAKSIFIDSLKTEDCSYIAKVIYSELGNTYNRLRDYEKAEFYQSRRKELCTNEGYEQFAAEACIDLGWVYLNREEYLNAINTFQEGLAFKEINLYTRIKLLNELASAHFGNNDFDKMLLYIQKCKNIVIKNEFSPEEKESHLYSLYTNYGKYYRAINEFELSEKYFDKAMTLLDKEDLSNKRWIAFIQTYKGGLYLKWKRYKDGLQEFHDALNNFLPAFEEKDIFAFPQTVQLVAEPNLMAVLKGKADCLMGLYEKNQDDTFSDLALKHLALAKNVDELILQDYVLSGSKLTALSMNREIKNEIIKINYNRWKENPSMKTAEVIFSISEQSRAILLMEGMTFSNMVGDDTSNDLRDSIQNLTQQIQALQNEFFSLPKDDSEVNQTQTFNLQKKLIELQEHKKVLFEEMGESNSNVNFSKKKSITISKVQASLKENQAFIEYFIFDTTGYIIMISPNDFFIEKIKWNERWSQMASEFKEHIFNKKNKTYIQYAHQLCQHLVHPIVNFTDADQLILVPDGELWNIPFDALLTEAVQEEQYNNFKTLPYLLNKKNISYAFSATLQQQMDQNKSNANTDKKFYAFAPSYHKIVGKDFPPIALRNNLDTLIFNLPEVDKISTLTSATSFNGSNASKENFLNILPQACILHLASHAKANLAEPDLSYIAFSNTGDTLNQPFRMYAYEMYNQPMSMELVVLSACETATGIVSEGEGVINIARTFAHGGTQSIVTTLWSIPDSESTKDIMVNFYKGLKEKDEKDVALRSAKLAHIAASDHARAHPKYWAAFTAVGNMNPIELDTFSWMPFLLGALSVVVFLGVIFLRGKN